MRGENDCRDYGRGASCTEVRARVVFVNSANVLNSSLRSSSHLTYPLVKRVFRPSVITGRYVSPAVDVGYEESRKERNKLGGDGLKGSPESRFGATSRSVSIRVEAGKLLR